MDIRYFQAVTSLDELNSEYLHKSLQNDLDRDTYGTSWKDKKENRRMEREYEYLKRKFEKKLEQV